MRHVSATLIGQDREGIMGSCNYICIDRVSGLCDGRGEVVVSGRFYGLAPGL